MYKKLILSICLINFVWLTSCSQNPDNYVMINSYDEQPIKAKHNKQHHYGGWYCPDNLRGFPAVNVQNFDKVPVVNGRLPTKEETMNGISLMFFDTTVLKNVKPLDMTLPKLARYYSESTKKNELIIVIQAAEIENDSIVGFRYLNGGNGSAWFSEIAFLADDEIKELDSTPFISLKSKINAPQEKIWNVITNPIYAKALGNLYNKKDLQYINKIKNLKIQYNYAPENSSKMGTITGFWENVYIQIDYNFNGEHYVQKFLISGNQENKNATIHIVSGPYGKDFEAQNEIWKAWLEKVKTMSEGI
jgi:hypothetical protein